MKQLATHLFPLCLARHILHPCTDGVDTRSHLGTEQQPQIVRMYRLTLMGVPDRHFVAHEQRELFLRLALRSGALSVNRRKGFERK